jgi:hypothetical protein
VQSGTTVSERFQMVRRKLIDDLGVDPSPEDAYLAARAVLTSLRRDESIIKSLSPRDRRVFPVLIDILESGVKSALKTVRIKQAPLRDEAHSLPGAGPCFRLPALRLIAVGSLIALLLLAEPLSLNPLLGLIAAAAILFVEAAPHIDRWQAHAEWRLLGRDRRQRAGGRRHIDHNNRIIDPDVSNDAAPGEARFTARAAGHALERVRLAMETSTFVDHIFDVMLSVDKTLCLIDQAVEEKPRTILEDKDILALMQDLIVAQADHNGELALILLRQIEPMLLNHGISVHYYTTELAGMFTLQSGPPGAAPATLRPALVASGRVLLPGVADVPRDAETRGVTP